MKLRKITFVGVPEYWTDIKVRAVTISDGEFFDIIYYRDEE